MHFTPPRQAPCAPNPPRLLSARSLLWDEATAKQTLQPLPRTSSLVPATELLTDPRWPSPSASSVLAAGWGRGGGGGRGGAGRVSRTCMHLLRAWGPPSKLPGKHLEGHRDRPLLLLRLGGGSRHTGGIAPFDFAAKGSDSTEQLVGRSEEIAVQLIAPSAALKTQLLWYKCCLRSILQSKLLINQHLPGRKRKTKNRNPTWSRVWGSTMLPCSPRAPRPEVCTNSCTEVLLARHGTEQPCSTHC